MNEEIAKGLSLFSEGPLATGAICKVIVDLAFDIALGRLEESDLSGNEKLRKVDPIIVKQGYSALLSTIAEFAKDNADPVILQAVLQDNGVMGNNIEYVVKRFEQEKENLRSRFRDATFRFPQVISVDWRLDYYLRSSAVEKVNVPLFSINLGTVEPDGNPGNLEFTCTAEQLQDLVSKLKDANKQIERSAAAFSL